MNNFGEGVYFIPYAKVDKVKEIIFNLIPVTGNLFFLQNHNFIKLDIICDASMSNEK